MKIVLDTCALIWWSLDPDRLSQDAKDACQQMEKAKNGIVPSISIWEIAIKIKNNKLDLGVDLNKYINSLKQSNVVSIISILNHFVYSTSGLSLVNPFAKKTKKENPFS